MKIEVTQAHIDAGRPGNCCACPVALAIQEALPKVWNVSVASFIRLKATDGTYVDCLVPPAVSVFIDAFDDGGPKRVQPFTFNLPVIPGWAN